MFIPADHHQLKEKVACILSKRPAFSNYYGVDLTDTQYIELPESLILKKNHETYSRIYFLSNNAVELMRVLKRLMPEDIINIPSKTAIDQSLEMILVTGGYKLCGIYERLYKNSNKSSGPFIQCYARPDELEAIYTLLYSHFNPYLDHLPSREELRRMIEHEQALVNRHEQSGDVTGVIIYTREQSRIYFNCWLDHTGWDNALFLLFNMFNYMGEHQIEKSYFWYDSMNKLNKKMYKILDYQPDGLKDYVFVKQ
ncbi:MAG: hypothetical protein Q8914_00240 [Bacteroidota bacterium]|nr:hypothetical protein [Bacteroidota bacterium]